jgi:hypothetical protein
MFFAKKNKGYFVELNENSVLFARTSAGSSPLEIEELRECDASDEAGIDEIIRQLQPRKPPSGYLHSAVGVYPARRVVRKHTLELKKIKEPTYMAEVFSQQLRIEQDKYVIAMLNATDGSDYDMTRAAQKEVVFCGAPTEDINAIQ